jgi:uncharacterized protein YdeI (BOF family)
MNVSSARKAAGMVVTAVAILALATASTFAGTGGSNGDNRLNNSGTNNKTGVWHKTDGYCGTDFELVDSSNAYGYDVNDDGWICQKWADDHYDYTDNTVLK